MTITFSLKQGETRTSSGPIPHPLSLKEQPEVRCSLVTIQLEVVFFSSNIQVSYSNILGENFPQLHVILQCFVLTEYDIAIRFKE